MPTEEQTYREGVQNSLNLILEQTRKTNGRVTLLERWQHYVLGFCAAVMSFITIGTAIIAAIITHNI